MGWLMSRAEDGIKGGRALTDTQVSLFLFPLFAFCLDSHGAGECERPRNIRRCGGSEELRAELRQSE